MAAAAAFDVVEDAVVVADFGTAVTIDLVDEHGVFQGGVICPGFEISAQALKDNTAQLPKITVHRPNGPYGKNTADAINCGLYYSIIGGMEEIVRRYAEEIGRWPQTIITGSGAEIIKDDCPFVDNYVPHLVVKGIVLAYMKYVEEKSELGVIHGSFAAVMTGPGMGAIATVQLFGDSGGGRSAADLPADGRQTVRACRRSDPAGRASSMTDGQSTRSPSAAKAPTSLPSTATAIR